MWRVEFDAAAARDLRKLGHTQRAILTYLRRHVATADDLRRFGRPDGELFWGNDRLEAAPAWTKQAG